MREHEYIYVRTCSARVLPGKIRNSADHTGGMCDMTHENLFRTCSLRGGFEVAQTIRHGLERGDAVRGTTQPRL